MGGPAPNRLRQALWLWPALATLLITAVQLDGAPLWRDELATWSAATRPVGDLLRLAGHIDAVSTPYYLLVHAWIAVAGDSVTALRLPSTFGMAGTAGLTTVLGTRLFGARTGLLAGLLFAVLPSTSRYGQEARPYAFASLLAVLATLLLVRALDRPGWLRWTGYAVAVVGLGLANLFAVSVVAGHAAAVALDWRTRRTGQTAGGQDGDGPEDPGGQYGEGRENPGGQHGGGRVAGWSIAVAAAAVLLAPLAVFGRGQQGRQLNWVERPGPGDLVDLPATLTQASTLGGVLLGLAAVGLAGAGRWRPVLAVTVLLPVALLFVGGQLTPLWVPRYLLFVLPFCCLLAATTLAPLRLPAGVAIVLVTGLVGAPEQRAVRRTHETPRSAEVDYPAAARIIAAGQRPGDGIVYSPRSGWAFLDVAIAYELRRDRPRDVLLRQDAVRRADLWPSECPVPATCLDSVDRVWLLIWGERTDPLAGVAAAKAEPLRTRFRLDGRWTVPGLTVALLTRAG
ncbi:glycosyltransferase family 39 protein [Plantactinospora sonchi]|uniref:Glycosyltransferase family 39 protein n=1 Tax=Plantactinospora sonchi TaxID=1544735 RepID=A0ABU7RL12_9ACTN